jgi:hypothetical protein
VRQDRDEFESKSYRRRIRWMDRFLAPFDLVHAIEVLLLIGGATAAIAFAFSRL